MEIKTGKTTPLVIRKYLKCKKRKSRTNCKEKLVLYSKKIKSRTNYKEEL